MPELPEVEVIVRRLGRGSKTEPAIVGRTIVGARVPSSKTVRAPPRAAFAKKIARARILDVGRRAKSLIIDTDQGSLVIHLRLNGDVHVVKKAQGAPAASAADDPKFTRVAFDLDDGHTLALTDRRHLAEVRLFVDDVEAQRHFADLGPEPLDDEFELASRLRGNRPIKAALMDQSVIAGVGNIYADEALFRARLWPERKTSSLAPDEISRLQGAIKGALTDSIDQLLADDLEIKWRYLDRKGESPFFVYDRAGEPCRACGRKLTSLRVGGRATVACTSCQNKKAGGASTPHPRSTPKARRSRRASR